MTMCPNQNLAMCTNQNLAVCTNLPVCINIIWGLFGKFKSVNIVGFVSLDHSCLILVEKKEILVLIPITHKVFKGLGF